MIPKVKGKWYKLLSYVCWILSELPKNEHTVSEKSAPRVIERFWTEVQAIIEIIWKLNFQIYRSILCYRYYLSSLKEHSITKYYNKLHFYLSSLQGHLRKDKINRL